MPSIQELHDQTKDQEDTLVLALNLDNNIGLVEPYLKKEKFTCPLVLGHSLLGVAAAAEVAPDRDAVFELLFRYMNPPGSSANMYHFRASTIESTRNSIRMLGSFSQRKFAPLVI